MRGIEQPFHLRRVPLRSTRSGEDAFPLELVSDCSHGQTLAAKFVGSHNDRYAFGRHEPSALDPIPNRRTAEVDAVLAGLCERVHGALGYDFSLPLTDAQEHVRYEAACRAGSIKRIFHRRERAAVSLQFVEERSEVCDAARQAVQLPQYVYKLD